MKHIVLFGADCGKCKKAEVNIKMALTKKNLTATFEKITDVKEMLKFNISYLPSVMIDNVVAFKGIIPSEKEIIKALNK